MITESLLTIGEVARLARIHENTVRRLSQNGGFPAPIRIGSSIRWRAEAIQHFLGGVPASPTLVDSSVSPTLSATPLIQVIPTDVEGCR